MKPHEIRLLLPLRLVINDGMSENHDHSIESIPLDDLQAKKNDSSKHSIIASVNCSSNDNLSPDDAAEFGEYMVKAANEYDYLIKINDAINEVILAKSNLKAACEHIFAPDVPEVVARCNELLKLASRKLHCAMNGLAAFRRVMKFGKDEV